MSKNVGVFHTHALNLLHHCSQLAQGGGGEGFACTYLCQCEFAPSLTHHKHEGVCARVCYSGGNMGGRLKRLDRKNEPHGRLCFPYPSRATEESWAVQSLSTGGGVHGVGLGGGVHGVGLVEGGLTIRDHGKGLSIIS